MLGSVGFFLNSTRAGLILRAVGNNHDSACPRVFGLAGTLRCGRIWRDYGRQLVHICRAYSHWSEGMTAGRGWIALALVVFASWMPSHFNWALLLGDITIMQLAGQARGWEMPSQFLSMLPYLATIAVLV